MELRPILPGLGGRFRAARTDCRRL